MRNKYWLLSQTLLLALVIFSPFRIKLHVSINIRYLGLFFVGVGVAFAFIAGFSLKENLKPSPKPRLGGYLVTSGLYRIVRHPAYSCIVIAALGWGLWMSDPSRILFTLALFVFFDVKSRAEERWLEKAYPEYVDYKKRVTKKLIPWIY